MLHSSRALVVAAMLSVVAACDSGRHTTAGFKLPADANLERGRQAPIWAARRVTVLSTWTCHHRRFSPPCR
jgi:hypothetical protein